MKKSIFTLAPIAAVFLVGMGSAQAANNAQITITANVTTSTCDVSLSTTSLDLGNYAAADFTAVNTPVEASKKEFTIGLSDCDTPADEGEASLLISGPVIAGSDTIFNSNPANTGILLSSSDALTTYLKSGDSVLVAATSDTPSSAEINGKSVTLQAAVASTSATPDIGLISAPILFSFTYN